MIETQDAELPYADHAATAAREAPVDHKRSSGAYRFMQLRRRSA